MPKEQDGEGQKTGPTDGQGQDSPPENKNDQAPGQEDDSQVGGGKDLDAGLKRDIFKLREDRRELRSENEVLKSELEEIKALLAKRDDDAPKKQEEQGVDLRAQLAELLAEQKRADEAQSRKAKANEMFQRLQYTEDPAFADAVQAMMHQKYGHIIDVDPEVALDKAYQEVCRLKGVAYNPPRS